MNTEPALLTGLVGAILTLVVSFGIPITTDQRAAIMAAFAALVMLVQAVIVRYHVTPTAKIQSATPAPTPTPTPAPPTV